MELGIFAKTFKRTGTASIFDAVCAHGFRVTQFNMACAGLPSMPDELPPSLAAHIGHAAATRSLTLAAVSGTFNMIHPDPNVRTIGLHRLSTLAGACKPMGTSTITLCTGTRDPDDQWQAHPDNNAPDAWRDLCHTMERALAIAETHQVTLAIEPELGNVVRSAKKGLRLLREMRSSRLRVVFDAANLFEVAPPAARERLVQEGLNLLGDYLIMAHAKDRHADGTFCPAGHGVLNYDHYLTTLQKSGFDGPLILHGLDEADVPGCLHFLQQRITNSQ